MSYSSDNATPARNDRYYALASELSTDQFWHFVFDDGKNPASFYDMGVMWIDNGAELFSEDYAVFAWRRIGDEFVFVGQVRLMGSDCLV